jgi:hypothetical protein
MKRYSGPVTVGGHLSNRYLRGLRPSARGTKFASFGESAIVDDGAADDGEREDIPPCVRSGGVVVGSRRARLWCVRPSSSGGRGVRGFDARAERSVKE